MLNLTITTLDGKDSFGALCAGPENAPVIIVIQEIFGVNPGIRAKCDALATQGGAPSPWTCSGARSAASSWIPMCRRSSSKVLII